MNILDRQLQHARRENRLAFMAHVYAGDPDLNFTRRLVDTLADAIDILELGIPFADPLADGATFQLACRRALAGGVRVADVFRLAGELRRDGFPRPMVLTTYMNIVARQGVDHFARRLQENDIQGLIVPDLPLEEADELDDACRAEGIHLIHLVTPTAPHRRITEIARRAAGFLYVVSRTGVTGGGEADAEIRRLLEQLRQHTDVPLLLGFGISQPEQLQGFSYLDGFIIGSAICRIYQGEGTVAERLRRVGEFAARFRHLPRTAAAPVTD
ncbi:MAG: tryptophan synthase subunit alpha [Acidobacteria bacterium]|nr:tryptophan synthase subunit alpha [Acidobacteriota bacterium]